MRFVIDMNLSLNWAETLETDGHEAIHWQEVGRPSDRDEEILAHAAQTDRIVFTADLDFAEIVVRRRLNAPTIVQLRCGSTDPADIGDRVLEAIRTARADLKGGAVLTIDDDRVRIRRGPLTFAPTDQSNG